MKSMAPLLGLVIGSFGALLWVYGITTDTSVDVYEGDPVYNLGLLAYQSHMMNGGLALIVIGAVIIACGVVLNKIDEGKQPVIFDPSKTSEPADEYLG